MTCVDFPCKPLVSVVIPTFNYGRYIIDAVGSVLAQSYPAIEIIVVDDGSTDDTYHRISVFGDRVRYLYQENSGPSRARNNGIRAARGELIAFLDADDMFHPRKLEIQVAYLSAHPDVGMLVTNHFYDFKGNWPEISLHDPPADPVEFDELLIKPRFGSCGVIVRRECFDVVGVFDEGLRYSEDRDLWLRITAQYRVMKLRDPLWWYRLHGTSASRAAEKMEEAEKQVLRRAFKLENVRGRPVLRRRVASIAAWSAALMYRDTGMYGRAAIRVFRSLWYWPFPHVSEIASFGRLKLLCLLPKLWICTPKSKRDETDCR